jgi:hypothetical protein
MLPVALKPSSEYRNATEQKYFSLEVYRAVIRYHWLGISEPREKEARKERKGKEGRWRISRM